MYPLSLFKQGIPTLVNRHDRNYEIILKDVKAKVQQVSDIQCSRSPIGAVTHLYCTVH